MFSFGSKRGVAAPADERETYTPLSPLSREASAQSADPVYGEGGKVKLDKKANVALDYLLKAPDDISSKIIQEFAEQRPHILLDAVPFAKASHVKLEKGNSVDGMVNQATTRKQQDAQPILQFSCPKYFCLEEEPSVTLEVMRLHAGNVTSTVKFATKDATAIAGKAYEATSGELVFRPFEKEKQIEVKLIDDVRWGGVTEFQVCLEEESVSRATLSKYLSTARVQRIDDDTFPSNLYKKEILGRRLEDIDGGQLMREYFKYNFADPVIWWGTMKLIFLGQLKNLNFLFTLFANVFLVDKVLTTSTKPDAKHVWHPIGPIEEQHVALLALVALNFLPLLVLHYLDTTKFTWKVAGRSRNLLTGGLMNAFLNYNDASRTEVDQGALVEAMTTDTELIIKMGYMNAVGMFQLLGQIVMCLIFQVAAPLAFGSTIGMLTIGQMTVYPLLMLLVLACRLGATKESLHRRMNSKRRLMQHVIDSVNTFKLINDFNMRFAVQDHHEANVAVFNADDALVNQVLNNNDYVMKWLTMASIGLYTIIRGFDVIEGKIALGVFLTTLRVITQVGGLWNALYTTMLETLQCLPALIRIVDFTNLPGDSRDRMLWSRINSREMQKEMTDLGIKESAGMELTSNGSLLSNGGALTTVDALHLKAINLRIDLQAIGCDKDQKGIIHRETNMIFPELAIPQGQLIALVGKSGKGKTTLLKILGGASLPPAVDDGKSQLFIPSHLRVLHVPTETLFVKGGLYTNLVYGIIDKNHKDGRPARVRMICRRLGLSEKLVQKITPDETGEIMWTESLSGTEQHLIAIARAVIANPELLCLHKPTLHVSQDAAQAVIELLREFVDKRGCEQDESEFRLRRPRTCIITSTRAKSLAMMDSVFKVHAVDDGTRPHIQSIHKDQIKSEITLDDLC